MERSRSAWIVPALPAILAFLLSVYRAITLSITFDEATTYLDYVRPGREGLLEYSTNNHVLSSWLIAGTTAVFGTHEWALRLPALFGTALYLGAIVAIVCTLEAGRLGRLLAVALLSLNPLLLDFFCLARGYSLALGLFTIGLWLLVDGLSDGAARAGRLAAASAMMGLSCCANQSFLFVVAGLTMAGLMAVIRIRSSAAWRSVAALLIPGPVIGLALLAPYLSGMFAERDFVGFHDTSVNTIRDIVNATFFRVETAGSADLPPGSGPILIVLGDRLQFWVASSAMPWLVEAFGLLLPVLLIRGWFRVKTGVLGWLVSGALAINWLLFEVAHAWRDLTFPPDRLALYLVPLVLLALIEATAPVSNVWAIRSLGAVGLVLLGLSFGRMNPTWTRTWRPDAGIARYLSDVQSAHASEPERVYRVGGSWFYVTAVNFYRVTTGAKWIAPFVVGRDPVDLPDYFIRTATTAGPPHGYRVIDRDSHSATELLARMPN